MATTSDWLMLRGDREGFTTGPTVLEAHCHRTQRAAEHARAAMEQLTFSAWIQAMRERP